MWGWISNEEAHEEAGRYIKYWASLELNIKEKTPAQDLDSEIME